MNIARILNREDYFRMLVVGSAGEGKTYFIKYILPLLAYSSNNSRGFTSIYIFGEYVREKPRRGNTDPFFRRYLDFADMGFTVTEEFDSNHLLGWIEERRHIFEHTNQRSLLVMDDIVKYGLGSGEGKRVIGEIYSSCRHAGVDIITVCHHYTSIPPISRQQATHVVFTSVSVDTYKHILKPCMKMIRRVSDETMISTLNPQRREYLFFDIRAEKQFRKFRLS